MWAREYYWLLGIGRCEAWMGQACANARLRQHIPKQTGAFRPVT